MKGEMSTRLFVTGSLISSLVLFPFILDFTLLPRFISLSVVSILVIYFIHFTRQKLILGLDIVVLAYIAYTAFSALSACWAKNIPEALFESSKQILGLFVFMFTYLCLRRDQVYFIQAILKISIIVSLIVFLFAFYQFNKLNDLSAESLYLVSGLNGHKNLLSSFLFIHLFFLILASYKFEKNWKTLAIVSITLNFVLIFLLKTKAVWLALFICSLLYLILYVLCTETKSRKSRTNIYVVIGTVLVLLNLVFFVFLKPIIHSNTYSDEWDKKDSKSKVLNLEKERLILWEKTYYMIQKNPVLGVGMGNWQIHFPEAGLSGLWRAEDLNFTFQRPHNDFLWILSETGLIGFNLFLFFLTALLVFAIYTLRILPGNKQPAIHMSLCILFLIGYCVIAFFDFPKERIEHTLWINILMGFCYYLVKEHRTLKPLVRIQLSKFVYIALYILFAFIILMGAMRFKGEYFTRRMYNYKFSGQPRGVLDAGNSAISFAYTLDPTSTPIFWYTGNAHAMLKNYKNAQTDFEMAYALNPNNRNVLNDLASSYVYSNDKNLAKKYYEEAARISPRFDDPKLNLAALYINEGNFKMADYWLKAIFHDSERRSNYQRIVDLQK
jgi:O-antigen ligase